MLVSGCWIKKDFLIYPVSSIQYPASLSYETLQKVLYQFVGLR